MTSALQYARQQIALGRDPTDDFYSDGGFIRIFGVGLCAHRPYAGRKEATNATQAIVDKARRLETLAIKIAA